MSRCGVCGQRYGDLMMKHAEVCEDDTKAPAINDIIRIIEEAEMEEENE